MKILDQRRAKVNFRPHLAARLMRFYFILFFFLKKKNQIDRVRLSRTSLRVGIALNGTAFQVTSEITQKATDNTRTFAYESWPFKEEKNKKEKRPILNYFIISVPRFRHRLMSLAFE